MEDLVCLEKILKLLNYSPPKFKTMLIDARKISDQDTLATDLCIIGAGPAGITMAREFNGLGLKVLLLETGGFEHDSQAQDLSKGSNEGDPYPLPESLRERLFGGTSVVWPIDLENGRIGVRYVPLDPIDFEHRDWVPHSGWPITRTDLDPYYARANHVAQAGPYNYDPDYWQEPTAKPLPFTSNRLRTQIFQFGPKDIFTQQYRDELEQSSNVTIAIYAHALRLETDELAKTVTSIHAGTVSGNRFQIQTRAVALTQGGLETARLLLLSNSVQTCGLGNGHDLVGRFLMDHPIINPGTLVPKNRHVFDYLALYDARWVKGARIIAKPALTEQVQRQEGLMNINTALFPRPAWRQYNLLRMIFPKGQRNPSPALRSARTIVRSLKAHRLPPRGLRRLAKVLLGIDDLIYDFWRNNSNDRLRGFPLCHYDLDHGGWSKLENKPQQFGCFDLLHITEQAPDPHNRMVLSNHRDQFGDPRIAVHWQYNEIDRQSVKRSMEIFAEEFSQVGLGDLHIQLDHGSPSIWKPSMHHPMGTTRMHNSPHHGVVDANCQVHGVSNLFIASSSVFPTGGYANPTLTILALAIRVADHLKTTIK